MSFYSAAHSIPCISHGGIFESVRSRPLHVRVMLWWSNCLCVWDPCTGHVSLSYPVAALSFPVPVQWGQTFRCLAKGLASGVPRSFLALEQAPGKRGRVVGGEGWADRLAVACFLPALRTAFWYRYWTRPIMIHVGSMFHNRPRERVSSVVFRSQSLLMESFNGMKCP